MTVVYAIVCATVIIAALLMAWSRRHWCFKTLGVLLAVGIVAGGWYGLQTLLSRPLPVETEDIARGEDVPVLGFKVIKYHAIYILLDEAGEPRYYVLAWSEGTQKMGEALEEGTREAKAKNGVLIMKRRTDGIGHDDVGETFEVATNPDFPEKE